MNSVLEFFRQEDPRFKEVPDRELSLFIGETYPEFLEDPHFKEIYGMRTEQRDLEKKNKDLTELEGIADTEGKAAQLVAEAPARAVGAVGKSLTTAGNLAAARPLMLLNISAGGKSLASECHSCCRMWTPR
jgi:hypothetical protein